ncbi:hypothetical protein [Bradyrhizobium sp. CCBAU 51765]|uniref:hypothetical protein n=1 Tax=Bradyrhizobium sp. CCBAU 51765 TaxID=1325102 RepID=UPI001886D548|nr:hypothetical protein [Bradyrhizobium sp. CCBAU 51765]
MIQIKLGQSRAMCLQAARPTRGREAMARELSAPADQMARVASAHLGLGWNLRQRITDDPAPRSRTIGIFCPSNFQLKQFPAQAICKQGNDEG